jgi:hypothetical protein
MQQQQQSGRQSLRRGVQQQFESQEAGVFGGLPPRGSGRNSPRRSTSSGAELQKLHTISNLMISNHPRVYLSGAHALKRGGEVLQYNSKPFLTVNMLLAAMLLQGRVSVLTTRWPACWWLLRRSWGPLRKGVAQL